MSEAAINPEAEQTGELEEILKKGPSAIVAVTSCSLCNQPFRHGAVTMLGKSGEDKDITIHPECLTNNSDVKSLDHIHIHLETGKKVSSAKKLVIQKKIKAIYKAVAIANQKKAQENGIRST